MTQPGMSSHGIPPDPRYALAQRLAQLERRLDRLETANPLQATTISSGGFEVDDDNGQPIVKIGTLGLLNGQPAVGVEIFRDDGSLALTLYSDFVAIWDKSGNYVVTDDATSGQGLARPYISYGSWVDQVNPPRTTTSASFVTQQTIEFRKSHPKIEGQLLVSSSDSSTTGEARITTTDGTQLGSVITIDTSGGPVYAPFGPYAVPGDFLDKVTLNLQVRRTGGNGQVGAVGASARGIESGPLL